MNKRQMREALDRAGQICAGYHIGSKGRDGDPARAFGYLEQAVEQFLGDEDQPNPDPTNKKFDRLSDSDRYSIMAASLEQMQLECLKCKRVWSPEVQNENCATIDPEMRGSGHVFASAAMREMLKKNQFNDVMMKALEGQNLQCFSCGVDWSIEIANELCGMAHREHWHHEWVSARARQLTQHAMEKNNLLDDWHRLCKAILADLDATGGGLNQSPTLRDTTFTALRVAVESRSVSSGYPEAVEVCRLLDLLRMNEGASVALYCENPEGSGPDNQAIDVSDDWTGPNWESKRFEGETLLHALKAAVAAKVAAVEQRNQAPPPASSPAKGPVGEAWRDLL